MKFHKETDEIQFELQDLFMVIKVVLVILVIMGAGELRSLNQEMREIKSQIAESKSQIVELKAPKPEVICQHEWVRYSFMPKNIRWCKKCKIWGETIKKK